MGEVRLMCVRLTVVVVPLVEALVEGRPLVARKEAGVSAHLFMHRDVMWKERRGQRITNSS